MDKQSLHSSLMDMLLFISETEMNIEVQRKAFANSSTFDSFGYFRYLDQSRKNYITYEDLNNFLSMTTIKYSMSQLKEIIRLYDKDNDTCWNYEEFCSFTGSKSYSNNYNSYFSLQTDEEDTLTNCERELGKLFKMEIIYLEYLGIKVKSLKSSLPYDNLTYTNIYDIIKGGSSSIGFNELFFYMKERNAKIISEDVKYIYKRLTKNENGILTAAILKTIFSYEEKFITETMTDYVKTKGYYKVNPVYPTDSLFYTVYTDRKNNESKTHLTTRSFVEKKTGNNKYKSTFTGAGTGIYSRLETYY